MDGVLAMRGLPDLRTMPLWRALNVLAALSLEDVDAFVNRMEVRAELEASWGRIMPAATPEAQAEEWGTSPQARGAVAQLQALVGAPPRLPPREVSSEDRAADHVVVGTEEPEA